MGTYYKVVLGLSTKLIENFVRPGRVDSNDGTQVTTDNQAIAENFDVFVRSGQLKHGTADIRLWPHLISLRYSQKIQLN